MKIVIFSDSHGDVETMRGATEKEKPDMIIYLGDGIADAEQINKEYPDIEMITVPGNMDADSGDEELIKFADIRGKRFVITHGHMFKVEFKDYQPTDESRINSRNSMLKCIDENNADILLHGHTHEPYINRALTASGKACWIMNPGSVRRKDDGILKPVYGVLIFDASGSFEWRFKEVGV
jgi:putative phosphoesterase